MSPENFVFWLQGFFEIGGGENLSPEQVQVIKDHLALVFNKVTPNRSISGNQSWLPDTSAKSTPDYYIGSAPYLIPMWDEYNADGSKKERYVC